MTKKNVVKLRRYRAAVARKRSKRVAARGHAALPRPPTPTVMDAVAPLPPAPVADSMDHVDSKATQQMNKFRPSARCAIVAAAFAGSTTGTVRRQLKRKDKALAVIVLVPGSSWIEPVRKSFDTRFGNHWQTVATDTAKNATQKTERNNDVAAYLTKGVPVVGIAVDRDALPSVLVSAADLTIRIAAPTAAVIGRAMRMVTRMQIPDGIEETIAAGLEFHDLVAAFRTNSTPSEILERLRKASPATRKSHASERLPSLDDAVEYGDARTWGLSLARDLADYRAGRIDWQDVDRGAVLFSEPGLGKSLFARILAQACGVPLAAYSVADLFASSPGYLDSVIKASRAMFEQAAALAPCILFLDEIDALPNRAKMSPRGADWWTAVITDFLLSLDNAVAGKRAGIVVVAATNHIEGVDAALMRPGRLERAIEIRRPDKAGALNILRHHLNGDLHDADLDDVAGLLEGSTGAEIMMLVRDGRRVARYAGRPLERDDLLRAITPMEEFSDDTLWRVCIHEAAHAVASLAVSSGVLTRCVVGSRAGAAGHTLIRRESNDLLTRDAVERRVVMMLAGRTAEQHLIGNASLGAGGDDQSDLALVTQLVATLHASTGLGETLAYLVAHQDALAAVRSDRDLRSRVEKHMQDLQIRTDDVVRRHRDAILAVADQLRTRRQLSGDEVRRIFDENAPLAPAGSAHEHADPAGEH
ncbi:MAG: AAA family ATPase [Rhizobiales bacterium]|nr:AAA family ATPase [Hyphomicrobiales bacterium]